MDGIHDLGGMEGFGPVVRDESGFHADWERRTFAMALLTLPKLASNGDDLRHSIERLHPAQYLTAGYYGRWLAALEVRLTDRGVVSSDAVDARAPASAPARPHAAPTRGLPDAPDTDGPLRTLDRAARFAPGDRVRVADVHPSGHTRLPRYVRGRTGTVALVHPGFAFPDTMAHGEGAHPQPAYAVTFLARELWGAGDHLVTVDVFETHLEPA